MILGIIDTIVGIAKEQINNLKVTVSKTLEQNGLIEAKA